jgi:AcrR family transcriptional regulator
MDAMQEDTDTAPPNSRREKRRRAILDAAAKLFFENGYERTTLSDVLALSGGSRSTLADLFGGKEGLFIEVLRETSGHVQGIFDALDTNDAPIEVALKDFARQFIEAIFQPSTIVTTRILAAEAARFPEIAEAFFRMGPDMGDRKLAAFLQRSVDTGVLRPLDPVAMSRAFRGMIVGDTGLRVTMGALTPGHVVDALAQVDSAVEIFLSGVRGES